MKKVKPGVYLIGETKLVKKGLRAYLQSIDAGDWNTDAKTDVEAIPEVYGRMCYKSFDPKLNPNLSRVRKGNEKYIKNIVKSMHGSVLEHSSLNFIFGNVSRVFTHELVRHRAGVAISQESLRYVRLSDLKAWFPTVIEEDDEAVDIFVDTIEKLEQMQLELSKKFDLDNPDAKFAKKKIITSAMRRIAPMGLATNIGWTTNLRTLRWVLELRTSPHAEEEIRYVFNQVGDIVMERYPNVFGDFEKIKDKKGELSWFKPEFSKV